ncbi:MAG: hypothetical protein QI197_06880 [Candidatus Korarchaeota archaeon]|nr:hypothetical protein [Candidatus Korarchaeota archaeon]
MSRSRPLATTLVSLGLISIIAVSLSYISISSFRTYATGSLTCSDGEAILYVVNGGARVKVYYVSVVLGDRVMELRRVDTVLDEGETLDLRLELPKGSKVSVLLDRGVISSLSCGERRRSQP